MSTPTKTFGSHLKSLRKSQKMTQVKVSQEAGISKSYISFLESDIRHPSREVVLKLSAILDLSAEQQDLLLMSANYAPLSDINTQKITNSEQKKVPDSFAHFEAFMQFVIRCIRTGDEEQARTFIEQGFQHYNRPAQMQTLLAHLELSRGNFSHAVLSQETALRHAEMVKESESIDYMLNLGVMYFLWGDNYLFEKSQTAEAVAQYEKALGYFEQGLQLAPRHVYLRDEAARVHFNLADLLPAQAETHWQKVIEHFRVVLSHLDADKLKTTHRLESAVFLGLAYSKCGDYTRAELLLDTLRITTDTWLVSYVQACHCCLKYRQHSEAALLELALTYFERAAHKSPEAIAQAIEDQHKDLHPLQNHPRFQRILKEEQQ